MDHGMMNQKKMSSDQCSPEWNLQFAGDKKVEDSLWEATYQLYHMDYLKQNHHRSMIDIITVKQWLTELTLKNLTNCQLLTAYASSEIKMATTNRWKKQ